MYVTLDLSSLASGVRPKDAASETHPGALPKLPSTFPQDSAPNSDDEPTALDPSIPSSSDQIQILGISSQNPIISYRKQLYSCQWTAPLGTDIILKPASSTEDHQLDRQSRTKQSPVLATSTLRLSAQPVRPHTLSRDRRSEAQEPLPPKANIVSVDHVGKITEPATAPLPQTTAHVPDANGMNFQGEWVPMADHASQNRRNQAAFLSRLAAAKRARGEQDRITVHAPKRLTGAGWRSQRKELDAESEEDDDDGDNNNDEGDNPPPNEARSPREIPTPFVAPTVPWPRPGYSINGRKIGRPRSSKKARSANELREASRTAGLFSEYRPEAAKKRVPGLGTRGRRRRYREARGIRGSVGDDARSEELGRHHEDGMEIGEEESGGLATTAQRASEEDQTMDDA